MGRGETGGGQWEGGEGRERGGEREGEREGGEKGWWRREAAVGLKWRGRGEVEGEGGEHAHAAKGSYLSPINNIATGSYGLLRTS